MRYNEVIFLVTKESSFDDIGNQEYVETKDMVFANEMSVGMNEFYQAGANGIKPEAQFEVNSFEYNGQSELDFHEERYSIIRTSKLGDNTRIVCKRVIGK